MSRAFAVAFEALCALAGVVLMMQALLFMKIGWLVAIDPSSTSVQRQQAIALAGQRDARSGKPVVIQRVWVDYDRISRNVKRAVIASEDANFVDHPGIDVEALEKAYERNRKRGRVVSGGSTITQQLAKNLYLSGSRNYLRKGEEIAITFMLEFWLGKQRILELYLNCVEWGVGVFGIEAAAHHYDGVGADALSVAQAARLAAMLPNPRFFDTHPGSRWLAWKTDLILGRMGAAQVPDAPPPPPARRSR